MRLLDVVHLFAGLRTASSMEEQLRARRASSLAGLAVGLLSVLGSTAVELASEKEGLGALLADLVARRPTELTGPQWLWLALGFGGVATWLLLRHTGVLLREVREPFRYTFWVAPFADVRAGAGGAANAAAGEGTAAFRAAVAERLTMLPFDVRERLDRRVRRFSLLAAAEAAPGAGRSHIHVEGHWELRDEGDEAVARWFVHLMPSVRIGGGSAAATLAVPVQYLVHEEGRTGPAAPARPPELDAREYQQLVERVYSAVATEIYRQIDADVRRKVRLFPTGYLRALALLHEAEDFARSNTVDAYDKAIDLYRSALRWFEVSPVVAVLRRAGWRRATSTAETEARLRVGLAKCLVFRGYVAVLSGVPANPLFQVLPPLAAVRGRFDRLHRRMARRRRAGPVAWRQVFRIPVRVRPGEGLDVGSYLSWLEFPADSLGRVLARRPLEEDFARNQALRFEAYTVSALAYGTLGATRQGRRLLQSARAIDPRGAERHALFGLAAAMLELRLEQKILLLRKATEAHPDFQIAQFALAYHSEMAFRRRAELAPGAARPILDEYGQVLTINPGNVAALAAQGYLEWLTGRAGDLHRARRKFEDGCEVKALVRETYVGALVYGLARIAAEEGEFDQAIQRYQQAIAADPAIAGASGSIRSAQPAAYYDSITRATVARYARFVRRVRLLARQAARERRFSPGTCRAVEGFATSDYGCASINLFYRHGDRRRLRRAQTLFRRAVELNPRHAVARFNLHEAGLWLGEPLPVQELDQIARDLPNWFPPLEALARSRELLRLTLADLGKERRAQWEVLRQRLREEAQTRLHREAQVERAATSQRPPASAGASSRAVYSSAQAARLAVEAAPLTAAGWLRRAREAVAGHAELRSLGARLRRARAEARRAAKVAERRLTDFANESPVLTLLIQQGPEAFTAASRRHLERIDDQDVQIARAYAHVRHALGQSGDAARLARHLLSCFVPESFDDSGLLLAAVAALPAEAARAHAEDVADCELTRSTTVLTALGLDPAHANVFANWFWPRVRDPATKGLMPLSVLGGDEWQAAHQAILHAESRIHLLGLLATCLGEAEEKLQNGDKGADLFYQRLREAPATGRGAAGEGAPDGRRPGSAGARDWLEDALAASEARGSNARGNLLYNRQEFEAARAAYERSIALLADRPAGRRSLAIHHGNLAGVFENRPHQDLRGDLEQAVEHLREALRLDGRHQDYRDRLSALLLRLAVLATHGEEHADLWLLVTPLAVELSEDLGERFSAAGDGLSEGAQQAVATMREQVQEATGIRVPPIRFRSSDGLAPRSFLLFADELPIESGVVPEGADPAAQVVERVGRFALDRRGDYLGHQEVLNTVEVAAPAHLEPLRADPAALGALVTALRALASEGVPLTRLPELLAEFDHHRRRGSGAREIVEAMRHRVREALPGNEADRHLLRLGPLFERRIAEAIHADGGEPVVAPEPPAAQELLDAIRARIEPLARPALVASAALRPFARELTRLEFAELPVLSDEEVVPALGDRPLELLDLGAAP